MALCVVVFMLFCLFQVVPAPGNSRSCLSCNPVLHPNRCTHYHHCQGYCFVEVHQLNGVNWFRFGCGDEKECSGHPHNHFNEYGPIVCKQCCAYTGCEKSLCPYYRGPATTTVAPASTTASTLSMITSHASNPSATTNTMVNTTTICADHDDPTFTCADMTYFGYCNPNAGAGYALAQKRCQKTCGFCT
ncbi:uncharacterized protein LOC132730538 [Ruditapes philippinarum]|uniref:uncharacterized protein LOC132730538 n=1 Tax=Ruditapes philippinarum TaxID=129788 RepID=UPI00295B35D2|nr:uncharacterized protein LOC132730538 [Ruditapes philippinarum]